MGATEERAFQDTDGKECQGDHRRQRRHH
jgi:hypothetical protein